jgi:hypothetical protein
MRNGDWIQTYSGKKFWPLDPRPEEIFVEDIVHALSVLCRYGGHCTSFYSVAQHSLLVAAQVPPEDALWALLNDASEAYLVDIPRPIKNDHRFVFYKQAEGALMAAVCQRFNLPADIPSTVQEADHRMLKTEQMQLMVQGPSWTWSDLQPYLLKITPWTWEQSKSAFRFALTQALESS